MVPPATLPISAARRPSGGPTLLRFPRGTPLPAALLVVALLAPALPGQDRLARTLGQEQGLAVPPVWALAQDAAGFVWIGAEGGLFRYDGTEVRRWAPELIGDAVNDIATSPDGRVVVRERGGAVLEVGRDGARRLPAPSASRRDGSETSALDRDGILWAVHAGELLYLDRSERWTPVPPGRLRGERPRRVRADPSGGVLLITDGGVWRLGRESEPHKLYAAPFVMDVAAPDPERVLVLANVLEYLSPRVVEIAPRGQRELASPRDMPRSRAISLIERGGTVWVSTDRFLIALRAGEPPELIGHERGIEGGGPLLLDREGSLWLASYGGVLQYPEPDTWIWGERDGLLTRHTRFVARTGDAVWVATWGGLGVLHRSRHGWSARPVAEDTRSSLCTDARGDAWTTAGGELVQLRDTVAIRWPGTGVRHLEGCTPARGGGVWVGGSGGLWHVDPVRRRVRPVPSPPGSGPDEVRSAALHDSRDRLWLGIGERICHAPGPLILAGSAEGWRCQTLRGIGGLTRMVELPSGTLWASTTQEGILVNRDGGWRPLSGVELPARAVFALVPSPRGGVWVAGHGILRRVAEDGADGWRVLEELTTWHGLPAVGGGDVMEDPDGTLWVATSRGVVQVPARVRFARRPPPPLALVGAWAGDQPLPLDRPLRLPHHRNHLEIRFAALSLRDPARVLHQVRLGSAEPWSQSHGQPSFRWVGLRPGRYDVEYRASVDGVNWPAEPIRYSFRVLPAWWASHWFLVMLALAAALLVYSAYRLRVAYLLGLERQRTRIALDLHDEVGSGLASVGILSGVLAADGLEERERREMAAEIATAAEELGSALSDIVWSLDPRTATLQELAARLAEHGGRLCAEGEPEFTTEFPARWPAGPLEVGLRRNVLLVGLEALHNAVRHARARRVVLSLLPSGAGHWTLEVRDDGRGIGAGRDEGRVGHGLAGMRRRAEEIGAGLEVRSVPGAGTAVSLRFRLRPGRGAAQAPPVPRWLAWPRRLA